MGFLQAIPVSILLMFSLTLTNCIEICHRMALTGFQGTTTSSPYIQFSGTYEVQDFAYNKFVVLMSQNIYFFYDDLRKQFTLGVNLGEPSFIGAIPKSTFSIDSWQQNIELNQPFASIIDSWFQTLLLKQHRIDDNISFKCVDNDYLSCCSGRLEFNQTLLNPDGDSEDEKYLNVYGQHYYEWQPNLYVRNRPVYMQRNTTLKEPYYLYYTILGSWSIGRNYTRDDFEMFVDDKALKPDKLTSTSWRIFNRSGTQLVPAKLQCQGVTTILGRSCMDADEAGQCLNNGVCHMTSNNEALCICPDGFHGVRCENPNVECSRWEITKDASSSLTNYFQVIATGNDIGHIATFFCPLGFSPVYFYAVCQASEDHVSGEWMGIKGCHITTLPPTNQTAHPTIEVTTEIHDIDDDLTQEYMSVKTLTDVSDLEQEDIEKPKEMVTICQHTMTEPIDTSQETYTRPPGYWNIDGTDQLSFFMRSMELKIRLIDDNFKQQQIQHEIEEVIHRAIVNQHNQ